MLRLLMFCLFLAVFIGCGLVSIDEVARVRSPTGRLDAVVVEINGGATTSFAYEVYVVPAGSATWRGKEVASLYAAVRNDDAYGVNLRWTSGNSLLIEYLKARNQQLDTADTYVVGQHVKIALRDGISDPTAPGGGMLYNLRQRKLSR